jgi:hypothetical protein
MNTPGRLGFEYCPRRNFSGKKMGTKRLPSLVRLCAGRCDMLNPRLQGK